MQLYPLDSIINEWREEYFEALFNSQQNWYSENEDLSEWVTFYIDAVYEQWERAYRALQRVAGKAGESES